MEKQTKEIQDLLFLYSSRIAYGQKKKKEKKYR